MKRTLIALAAALAVASAANAATMSIDTDKATYSVGELITITATLITETGDAPDGAGGSAIDLTTVWSSANAFVANGGPTNPPFGSSTQVITTSPFANLGTSNLVSGGGGFVWSGGSPNPCASAGPSAGNTCILISQSFFVGFGPEPGQVLTATLVLEASSLGSLGLVVGDTSKYIGGGITGPGGVSVGANFAAAEVVPEPTTAAMLGLGLLGLSIAGRRRS